MRSLLMPLISEVVACGLSLRSAMAPNGAFFCPAGIHRTSACKQPEMQNCSGPPRLAYCEAMEDDLPSRVDIELIVLDLERLARQAEANNLTFLTHLIERALIEARKQLSPLILEEAAEPERNTRGPTAVPSP